MSLRHATTIAFAVFWISACGGDSVTRPDPVVTLTIAQPRQMPFHGSGGPGTEPISISFEWTVGLSSTGGREVTVVAIRTELRESVSSASLAVAAGPENVPHPLRSWEPVVVPQRISGAFSSALYPGQWQGTTSVEIVHPSGRSETLRSTFSFR
jgi:hypothetical protein